MKLLSHILRKYFQTTEENTSNIPSLSQRSFKEWLSTMEKTREKRQKKILQLKIFKATVPVGLHPRLLKELAQQISQKSETIFILSLKEGKAPTY